MEGRQNSLQIDTTSPSLVPAKSIQRRSQTLPYIVLGGAFPVAAICNVVLPQFFINQQTLSTGSIVGYFLGGVLFAQIALLAIWAALGSQAAMIRFPTSATLTMVLAGCYCVGMRTGFIYALPVSIFILVSLAATYLAIQIPLLVYRRVTGQYIGYPEDADSQPQYSVKQLMSVVAIIAAMFAFLRGIFAQYSHVDFGGMMPDVFLVLAGLLVTVSLVICLPCIWIAFGRSPSEQIKPGVMLVLGLLIGPPVITGAVILVLKGRRIDLTELIVDLYFISLGLAVATLSGLATVRAIGMELLRPTKHEDAKKVESSL